MNSILKVNTEEDGTYNSIVLSCNNRIDKIFDAGDFCVDYYKYQMFLCDGDNGGTIMYSSSFDHFLMDTEEDYVMRYVDLDTMCFLTEEEILWKSTTELNKTFHVIARSGHRNMTDLKEYVMAIVD